MRAEIFGMPTKHHLPENWVPLEATAVLKCLDENGEPVLYLAHTDGITSWESIGMLTIARRTIEDELASGFIGDDDDA